MANATAEINTPRMLSAYDMTWEKTVTTSAQIYQGTMVGITTGGKFSRAGGASGGFNGPVVGRAQKSVLGDGTLTCRVDQGIFKWGNAGAAIAATDVGKLCYAADDNNVNLTNTNQTAGRIIQVDSDGVWVLSGIGLA